MLQEPVMFCMGNPYRILVVDCGIKENMLRNLVKVTQHLNPHSFTCLFPHEQPH